MTAPASFLDHYRDGPYREFAQEYRGGGTFGVEIMQVDQGAIECVDPALPQVCFVSLVAPSDPFETNFGDGWKAHRPGHRFLDIQPAMTECGFRLPDLTLRVALIQQSSFETLLDRHGPTQDAFSGVIEKFRCLPGAIAALDAMWAATARSDPAASLDLDGAFLTMLGELIAACGHNLGRAPKLSDRRLARAVDYAETHIAAPLTVGELAGAACMSPSAFSRAFRVATGETPWAFVRRRRLERAGERMGRTDDTLTQIAAECGFTDASHLARCWKRAYGKTPRGA
ncbi:AraC family transcriptional regulator [Jannaschia aquimarina]|uniref:CdhR_1 protein n=1 Tax=Jannaschia aquimarina TaxID=935700 RepID=A0A0D1DE55_9RHOB|nr:AraC family transcriptional regulator [Jannaschia aquimarina]KIT18228.1 HTH-type transcriptional regulator CdhR [Jannaschia aquimarina]SNS82904.1 Helix-turn-helix domain-containing protein [Jannaschia aquimarina]